MFEISCKIYACIWHIHGHFLVDKDKSSISVQGVVLYKATDLLCDPYFRNP